VLGLGDSSVRKTHYPSLRRRLVELERLRSELLRSEAYLTEAQRLSHTGSFGWKPDSGEIVWSDETYRIFEYDHAVKPTIDLLAQRVHPEDRPDFLKVIESASAGATQFEHTYRWLLPDGSVKHVHALAYALQDASGNREFVGAATDVTSIKRAEEELRTSEAYLAEAQRLSQTGSWAWSPDTDVRYWSEECYRVLGFDPRDGLPRMEELIRRIHADDQPAFRESTKRARHSKLDVEVNYRIVHPGGAVRDIHSIGHPVLSASGHLVEFVGTVIDVTERKRADQEHARLRQLEADLAHINRVSTLGEMAASLAHEIKQPIAAAITSAHSCMKWLAHEPPNLDRARAAAARIDKDGNRAAEIIDRIRSFYKKSPPQRELVDVNGIIEEMLTLLKGEANRYSVAMHTELAAELPNIMADRVQLQQVVMNLMVNGIEAMKDSGGELTVKSQLQDGQLQFSVSDTGVGLPTEGVDQMFAAFFTTKPRGSGMGLAISRSIVESHGGRLWATANGRCGATFHFTLPIQVTQTSPLVA
jgi:PAS domain S-box-containing protein